LRKETIESDGRRSTEIDCLVIYFSGGSRYSNSRYGKGNGISDAKLQSSKKGRARLLLLQEIPTDESELAVELSIVSL
jgi:hypothetical protein